jgi:hypothetical protein
MHSDLPFEVAAGTVPGRTHLSRGDLLVGRNNQDAFAFEAFGDHLVAVVTDGCGSSPHSEVGAKIGAKLTVAAIHRNLRNVPRYWNEAVPWVNSELFWDLIRMDVAQGVQEFVARMAGSLSPSELIIRDYFLFTTIVAVITPEHTVLRTIGDGFYALNGVQKSLGPFEGNMPPYLAYALVNSKFSPELLTFQQQECIATTDVRSLLIGSDGVQDLAQLERSCVPGQDQLVGQLSQFWEQDHFFKNSDAIRRRLALFNSSRKRLEAGQLIAEQALLPDDTTLVVIRRSAKE